MPRATIAIAIVIAGGVLVLGLIWQALQQFSQFSSCRSVVLSSTRSPDDTKAVFVFRQECNATVPNALYASIAPTDRPFSPDRNRAFLGFARSGELISNWRGNNVVEIALVPGGGPFVKHDDKVGNVEIDYK